MSVLFFTNYNRYLKTHEAFKLDLLKKWGDEFGFKFFVRILDDVEINLNDYPNFYFTTVSPSREQLKQQIDEAISKYKPKKVVNFLEKFFPFELVESDAERIYFVRSCAAKLLQTLYKYNDGSDFSARAITHYESLANHEKKLLNSSHRYLTTSINSVNSVFELYGITCELCLEYINPTKYNKLSFGDNLNKVYNIGRRDFQKGLQFVKPPITLEFLSIGKKEVDQDECVVEGIKLMDVLDFEDYKEIIKDCVYGIYPSIWESNGYAVQECLAMGKIPIVQLGSGGNERNLTSENSFVIDFNQQKTDWESIIKTNSKYKEMQENARNTITYEMYKNSFDKFIDKITS